MGNRKNFFGINLRNNFTDLQKKESVYDIFLRRRSVRNFSSRPIESKILRRLLEIVRRSPSAVNKQPYFFYVISGKQKEKFNQVFFKKGFYNAPVVIAGCALENDSWVRKSDNRKFVWVDVTIALTELIMAATSEGIGTCWVASFDLDKAKEILSLPENMEIVSLVVLGYPLKPLTIYRYKKRKKLKDICVINQQPVIS